ncbi:TetR/AcrR family transcriptional regulator [Psychromarinibacter sp. C21-152]|uniref:TetR/AcrR family transcriptional regulator n=1 Tax=Psychromarinibacter sediminicola TaxID=3033385 RepID=A0AAE3NRB4_9RHOB|nr:TetR/AcrR family transcriptional regulator [Psychromarinibacter sediminicola]MDF0602083.1 TetR/AcrR family transcriptional regulator [Psychromarinibacter sediminicola]
MKARSTSLRGTKKPREASGAEGGTPRSRLPHAERKAQILETAGRFFSEHGLTAQTRALAQECGISQRLLYRFFPTKEDLLAEVYREEILGHFKSVWFVELQDRSRPIEARLNDFYKDYLASVLTRRWLRLFMYASLADARMAPDYIAGVVIQLLELIVQEVAAEQGVDLPDDKDLLHEAAWVLHGAISHYAIRRHLYHAGSTLPEDRVVRMQVRMFIAGFQSYFEAEAEPSG